LGVAVIFVHHSGKGGQQRGTSGREDAVDNILKLSKPENYMDDDGAFFKICFTKARNADPAGGSLSPFGLKVCPDETRRGLIWSTEEIAGAVDKEVVIALLIDGRWKQREIAKQMDISQGRVAQIKKQAKADGYLDGKGNITGKGKKFVEGIDLSSYYGGG
jgi:putative DNA primase/helicase